MEMVGLLNLDQALPFPSVNVIMPYAAVSVP
jgi:hypothetical protein